MRPHKVSSSIVGVTLNGETRFISPALAAMDAPARKAWLFGGDGATRGSFELEGIFSEDLLSGDLRWLPFTRPLTFVWVLESAAGAKGGKRRAYSITQGDLGLTTMADPASFLEDLAYEVVELLRLSVNPTYAHNPATKEQAAKVRALFSSPSRLVER